MDARHLVLQGRNCWTIAFSRRAAVLIDGAAYFSAFRETAKRARHSIFVVGWDLDSRTMLVPDDTHDGLPRSLGPFLLELTARRPHLQVYLLNWDFSMLYATDRELLPSLALGWTSRDRLHFRLDGRHPIGACQHQKIVVVDDAVAFVGGMDLAQARWDTSAHLPCRQARCRANGQPYPPVHDVQLMVDGEAAAALGQLARERWFKVSGEMIPAAQHPSDPWPSAVTLDFNDVPVGIARTSPRYESAEAITEIRELYLDAIAAARVWIYIENQYLTSAAVGDALAARLAEPEGPEIIVVSRLSGGGWLEENTMSVLRARLLKRLRAADRYQHFRIYYPDRTDLAGDYINVHSKLMIVDDRILQIGSANLANRSMGFDSECDAVIEAPDAASRRAIAGIRNRLLGEHLDVAPERVAARLEASGSLIATVESLRGRAKTLRELPGEIAPEADAMLPEVNVIDPEEPIDADRLIEHLLPQEHHPATRRRLLAGFTVLLTLTGMAAAWHWGPLAHWLGREEVIAAVHWIQEAPATPILVMAIYLLATLAAMPITLLIFATALVFGPGEGFIYSMSGSLLGASATYALGQVFGRKLLAYIGQKRRLAPLGRWLRQRGLLAVVTARVLPVAPFSIVNLLAGAAHIRFRDFFVGTALGMLPGTTAVALFSDRLAAVVAHPSPANTLWLAIAVAVLTAATLALHRWLRKRSDSAPNLAPSGY